jgi:mono/diheme cytochrome c family protein
MTSPVNFERKHPIEDSDSAEIIRGVLKVQAAYAAQQDRPLGRGTHTKGICARATFEVFDLAHTIGDSALAARLAQGIYAKPGVYPATVRFANAASTIHPDSKPDLRALSFSVELSAGTFQDYSMQSATTFPINDAHTFAVAMRVLSAGSAWNRLKAIWSLSFVDFCRFMKVGALGFLQEHGKTRAYQQMRYWSTVPFRNGSSEAVKYSAIPREGNQAQPLGTEPNALQDELIRHLNEDSQMSSFDVGLQLLDAERMTRWGFRRDASYWVENATVEWKEDQAPFHVVGRLTLEPKSAFQPDVCEPKHIDVTEHATPDTQPLGSVNRARRAAELASRKVRLGEATAESILDTLPQETSVPRTFLDRLGKVTAVLIVAFVAVYAIHWVAGAFYDRLAARNVPAVERVDQVVYLNQGWGLERGSKDRETYYYTSQGTTMHGIRYSWFVNLERPFHDSRFADPDHMRALNFIVDPFPTPANPDRLPIGFAKRYDDTIHDNVIGLTCATCHNGQLNFTDKSKRTTTAIRIDGGPALSAITDVTPGSFQFELGVGLGETLINPLKFLRFAERVLGPSGNSLGNKWRLWRNLSGVSLGLAKVGLGSSYPALYPVQEGYGRTDALARIGNVVFGDHMTTNAFARIRNVVFGNTSAANYRVGDAPVSYPYLWNIWKFSWVQYGGSVSQPMARNQGEALGVGATFSVLDDYGRPIPPSERFRTSISFENQNRIESTLQTLTPPRWPADVLGPINQAAADHGKMLFEKNCVRCHGPHIASQAFKQYTSPGRGPKDPLWVIRVIEFPKFNIGTDRTAADNFVRNRVDITSTGISFDELKYLIKREYDTDLERQAKFLPAQKQEIARSTGEQAEELQKQLYEAMPPLTEDAIAQKLNSIDLRSVDWGTGLNILGMVIREKYYTDNHFSKEARECFDGFGTLDLPQVLDGYKPRPLEGVWATAPFLHNGSVPNLYEMLSPVEERSKRFFVGRREFDPVKVGLATEPVAGSSSGFWLDTSIKGNSNCGHEFRNGSPSPGCQGEVYGPTFSPADRWALVEYLKVHRDGEYPPDWKPQDCIALLK